MTRQTALLALLLLGGCHKSTSQPAATPPPPSAAPAPTARAQPAPRAEAPAPAAASQQAQAQVTAPPSYSSAPSAPDIVTPPQQGEIVQAYPTTGGTMQTPSSAPMPQGATGPSTQAAPQMERPVPGLAECEGLSNVEIMRPVLGDATETRPLTRLQGRQRTPVPNGVAVRLTAQEGHNMAYIQRLVDCQTAQARASTSPRATASPLAVEGTRTRVVMKHGTYELLLTNPDPERAREIQRRAETIAPQTTP